MSNYYTLLFHIFRLKYHIQRIVSTSGRGLTRGTHQLTDLITGGYSFPPISSFFNEHFFTVKNKNHLKIIFTSLYTCILVLILYGLLS